MLGDDRLDELHLRGVVRVPALIAPDEAGAIEDRIWAFLAERDGIDRLRRETWPSQVKKLQGLRKVGVFDPFLNEMLDAISEELLGEGWHSYGQRPQALLNFPEPTEWTLPHKVWHFDLPARGPTDHPLAVRYFGFVNRVAERGGATLVVQGSHELVRRMVEASTGNDAGQSADVRKRLIEMSPWFRALATEGGPRVRRFMVDGDLVDGVEVRVVELTGEPGDVTVMHPWMLHNMSQNAGDQPRLVMTHSVYAHDSTFF